MDRAAEEGWANTENRFVQAAIRILRLRPLGDEPRPEDSFGSPGTMFARNYRALLGYARESSVGKLRFDVTGERSRKPRTETAFCRNIADILKLPGDPKSYTTAGRICAGLDAMAALKAPGYATIYMIPTRDIAGPDGERPPPHKCYDHLLKPSGV